MKTYAKKLKICDTKICAKMVIYAHKKMYAGKFKTLKKMQEYAQELIICKKYSAKKHEN